MNEKIDETAAARRERRARAIWSVQGAGLPWSSLTADERQVWLQLADAVEASDRAAGGAAAQEADVSGTTLPRAAPGLRAHAPVIAAMQDLTAQARAEGTFSHLPEPSQSEGRVSVIGRSVIALVLFLAAAAGLLYLGLVLAG